MHSANYIKEDIIIQKEAISICMEVIKAKAVTEETKVGTVEIKVDMEEVINTEAGTISMEFKETISISSRYMEIKEDLDQSLHQFSLSKHTILNLWFNLSQ
jgi:hypothetical protein